MTIYCGLSTILKLIIISMIEKIVELVQDKPELFISNYLENYLLKEYFDDYSLDSTIQDLFPYLTILQTCS